MKVNVHSASMVKLQQQHPTGNLAHTDYQSYTDNLIAQLDAEIERTKESIRQLTKHQVEIRGQNLGRFIEHLPKVPSSIRSNTQSVKHSDQSASKVKPSRTDLLKQIQSLQDREEVSHIEEQLKDIRLKVQEKLRNPSQEIDPRIQSSHRLTDRDGPESAMNANPSWRRLETEQVYRKKTKSRVTSHQNLPNSYTHQEANTILCQGRSNKEHACLEHPNSKQSTLNSIHAHQYITQAVNCKQTPDQKPRNDLMINNQGSMSESKVQQIIAKAIDGLASKVRGGFPRSRYSHIECFFCKRKGHIKKDCRNYHNWLAKKGLSNPNSLNAGHCSQSVGQNSQPIRNVGRIETAESVPLSAVSDGDKSVVSYPPGETDGSSSDTESELDFFQIQRVRAGSSFINLKVGGKVVKARIDSGAEITVLSTSIYQNLEKKPAKIKDVIMEMADKENVLKGFVVEPVSMQIGSKSFCERLYVAPIGDDMLLGHDLMHHLGVKLDMGTDKFIIDDVQVPVHTEFPHENLTVARVSLQRKVVVPPNSVVRVTGKLDKPLSSSSFIESADIVQQKELLMPRVLRPGGEAPVICLVNPTDSYRHFKKDVVVDRASEYDSCLGGDLPPTGLGTGETLHAEVLDTTNSSSDRNSKKKAKKVDSLLHNSPQAGSHRGNPINKTTSSEPIKKKSSRGHRTWSRATCDDLQESSLSIRRVKTDLLRQSSIQSLATESPKDIGPTSLLPGPVHSVFQSQVKTLSQEQRQQVKKYSYRYVFARSDWKHVFPLEHTRDTGDAKSVITQQLRKTPAYFASEERSHLREMLKAGVSQVCMVGLAIPTSIQQNDGSSRWFSRTLENWTWDTG